MNIGKIYEVAVGSSYSAKELLNINDLPVPMQTLVNIPVSMSDGCGFLWEKTRRPQDTALKENQRKTLGNGRKWLRARGKDNSIPNKENNKLTYPIQIGKKRQWQFQDEDSDIDDENEASKGRKGQIVCIDDNSVSWW